MAKGKRLTKQTALKAWVENETVTKKYLKYATEFHSLRVLDSAVENFLNRLGKSTKKGKARYTDKEKHAKMKDFIVRRAKLKTSELRGEEWERSLKSLLWEVFREPWDNDTDKNGNAKSENQAFASNVEELRGAGSDETASAV